MIKKTMHCTENDVMKLSKESISSPVFFYLSDLSMTPW